MRRLRYCSGVVTSKPRLILENIGPIRTADISLSDLTVLVGPQASGKSLFLEFLKLVIDHASITNTMRSHGLDWNGETAGFLDLYLGRGMSAVWSGRGNSRSWVQWQDQLFNLDAIAAEKQPGRNHEECFSIPAQRVLAFSTQGWLRPFSDFRAGDPYIVRAFSEQLRVQAEAMFEARQQDWSLGDESDLLLQKSVFGKYELDVVTMGAQKELILTGGRSRKPLPFMVWSAGQREFVPLLLALTWLLPAGRARKKPRLSWVLIEEPEMGLHPKAIAAVLFVLLELLARGYHVCLSTHSTHVLDLIWALQVFRKTGAPPGALLDLFRVGHKRRPLDLASKVLNQETCVYYFDTDTRKTRDISSLDPNDPNSGVNTWGGLTEFSSSVGDAIAKQVAGSATK
jgi:energy-coupling factor transporter ATP-binding protein EcfA2